ncbi:MAG: ribonuclease P protein component [Candidatus Latescibacterota bacterium]|nr:MAG: ribonuclease P protein component [Candidatus Latescibacterota bacterium]
MTRNVLRSPWQFRLVYQTGKKITCKYAVLFYHKTGEPNGGPLFGVVASKRVGGAVNRNRAKRLLREAIRGTAHRFKSGDLWVVLVAKRSILDATFDDLTKDLRDALVGEGLIRGEASS